MHPESPERFGGNNEFRDKFPAGWFGKVPLLPGWETIRCARRLEPRLVLGRVPRRPVSRDYGFPPGRSTRPRSSSWPDLCCTWTHENCSLPLRFFVRRHHATGDRARAARSGQQHSFQRAKERTRLPNAREFSPLIVERARLALDSGRYRLQGLGPDVPFCSAPEICIGEIDELVAVPAENCLERKQAKTFCLFKRYSRRHREFVTTDWNFKQSGAVILQSCRYHRPDFIWRLSFQTQDTGGLGQFCKVWVLEIRSKINKACRLHFELNKSERIVLEDHNFDWSF